MSLLEYYRFLPWEKKGFKDVRFRVMPKKVVRLEDAVETESTKAALKSSICFPQDEDQAGYDMATLETMPNNQDLLLYYECKYSQKDTARNVASHVAHKSQAGGPWAKEAALWKGTSSGILPELSCQSWVISPLHIQALAKSA
jgi:hypothetical protein